jgi:subfamily B ATP-binding cassette protein HlyB/CyaB
MEEAQSQAQSPAKFLSSVDILSPFADEELEQLAAAIQVRHYAFGDTICKAGEPAEGLCVVKSGSVRVFSEEHGKEVSIGVRKAGEVIGDIAMLREVQHELSARASLKTELWFIPRAAIEPVLIRNPVARDFVTSYVAISSAGGLVARLFDLRGKVGKEELEAFVRSVGVKRVAAGKEILKQDGRDDRRLYVLRQGQVKLLYHDGADEYTLATLQAGETFGEKACLMRQEQMASAVAVTPATLLVIPEKTAHAILERNAGLREAGRPHPFYRA